jgi:hypothetical protein
VYATLAGDRLPEVVAAVGAGGCALLAVAFVTGRASVFPVGLAGVGAAYGVYVSLRGGAVDARAPMLAAALFLAAELGYSLLGRGVARAERTVVVRRLAWLTAAALVSGLLGILLLALTSGVGGGVGLEAAGVGAAALAVAAIALLASRSSV